VKRFARFFIASFVFAGFLAAGPAVIASASSGVQVTWVTDTTITTKTYSCETTSYSDKGASISAVTNNCGYRLWLHQDAGGGGSAPYCINPGALASGFGVYKQIQVTGNTAACDVSDQVVVTFYTLDYQTQYNCVEGAEHWFSDQFGDPYVINTLQNHCNTRVWLYYNQNGSGGVTCVSPNGNYTEDYYNPRYYLSISANQAHC
jgi:hypothetical protein